MRKVFQSESELIENFNKLTEEGKWAIDLYPNPEGGYVLQWIERKMYVAQDGKSYQDEVWVTKENEMMNVQDIEPAHAQNILRLLIRNARQRAEMMQVFQQALQESLAAAGTDSGNFDFGETLEGTKPTLH